MAKPVPISIVATILTGTSITPSIDLTQGSVVIIIAPNGWTEAKISFQVSFDNISFFDLFDSTGFEISRFVVPGAAVEIVSSLTQAALYFKIRSGSRADPIAQESDRIFQLILV